MRIHVKVIKAQCCHNEQKYLFTQALLHSLEKSSNGDCVRALIDYFEEYMCNLYVSIDK
jgi:hypothetical protein